MSGPADMPRDIFASELDPDAFDMFDPARYAPACNDGGPDDPLKADRAAQKIHDWLSEIEAQLAWQAGKAERDAAEKLEEDARRAREQEECAERLAEIEAEMAAAAALRDSLAQQDSDYHAIRIGLGFLVHGASLDGEPLEEDHNPALWELDEDGDPGCRKLNDLCAAITVAIEPWVSHIHSLGFVRADLVNFTTDGEPGAGLTGPRFFLIHRADDADLSAETLASLAPTKLDLPNGVTLDLFAHAAPINATMLHDAMQRGGPGVGQWGGEATPDLAPSPDESRNDWLARVSFLREPLARLVERWVACGRNVELFRCYGDWTERANGNQEIECLVDGVLFRGEVITVAGASGAGKSSVVHSWLSALSAQSLHRPRHVLGIPITGHYVCALVAGEEGNGFINYREKKHAAAWGPGSYFVLNDPNKSLADHIHTLSALPVLDVVVVDTVGSFFTGDEKSSAATRAFLAPLHKLARTKSCAIILVHHMTKGGENVKSIAGMKPHVKGAGDFVSAVRLVIGVIKPIEDGPELIVGPIKHNLPPEAVWLPVGTGRRYLLNDSTFTLDPIAERGDRSAADGEQLETIFEAIAEQNKLGRTLRQTGRHSLFEQKMPQLAGVSRRAMGSVIATMIEAGRVADGPDGLVVVWNHSSVPEAA